jgi:hypothetical protein
MLNPRQPWRAHAGGGASAGAAAWLALSLLALTSDAAAAPLSVVATSVGPLFALGALVVAKAHATGSLKAAGGAVALSAVAVLMWRGVRGSPIALLRRRSRAAGPSGVLTVPRCPLPAELDRAALTRQLGDHFVRLQSAWDAGDVAALARLTTAGMLDDLRLQLAERGAQHNRTEFVTLNTQLLSFERCDGADLACVEFSGAVRESDERGVVPFTEIWMLVRSHDTDPWRLARQQALL